MHKLSQLTTACEMVIDALSVVNLPGERESSFVAAIVNRNCSQKHSGSWSISVLQPSDWPRRSESSQRDPHPYYFSQTARCAETATEVDGPSS